MKPIYIHRQIEKLVKKMASQFPSVAVTGPRQSGKSTLLKKIFPSYNYLSFDDPINRERAISDPNLFLDNAGNKVIIDEIQYVPQLLSYIKIRIDEEREKKGRFILTGSQQFSLIKNLGDSLAGRIALLDLLPFNVSEKRNIPGLKTALKDTSGCFTHACLNGSFPEPTIQKKFDLNTWHGAYLQTYIERDVRTLYNIGNLRDFQQFMSLLASRCSQTLNMSAFANDLGIGVNTIKRWLSILEASRIIYLLPPYYSNMGKRVTKAPKIYFIDCGLVSYITGIKNRDHIFNGPLGGALFENFCIQETIKYFINRGNKPKLYYYRSHNGLEIDLLIEGENRILYPIEIKLSKTPKISMANNIKRYKKQFPKLKISDGRILSLSSENITLSKDIWVQNLDDYFSWLEKF